MGNELQRSFTTAHSYSAIEREIEMAQVLIDEEGTAFPDSSFEEGYIAAMQFILTRQGSNVREEYEALMDEQDGLKE
ncbi:hypothetical protein AAFX60_018965 [Aliivibrio fischeri]